MTITASGLRKSYGTQLVLEVDGAPRRVPIADIASARTVADWSAELKGTKV